MTKRIFLSAILAMAAALTPVLPLNASLSISAEVDKTTLAINDSLTLVVSVSGDSYNVPEPEIPAMQNFNIYSSGRSQNISIVNSRISASVSFTYNLTPRYLGKQTIPPIQVSDGKTKHATAPIEITVVKNQGGTAGRPAQERRGARRSDIPGEAGENPIFVTVETDKTTAYQNEQINFTVRFYTSVPLMSNPQYIPPQFKDIIAEDLPPVRAGETVIKGVRYYYNDIKTALFGIQEGVIPVTPARITAQVQTARRMDPLDPDFFQSFFSSSFSQGETREFKSRPVNLRILPLPGGAPSSFNGAVGNYVISAAADRKELKAGEALTLSITLSGNGNLKTVLPPKLPDMPGFRVYDTMSSLDITKSNDTIGGKKVFTTILIPKTEGRQTIPPVRFSFFDPDSKKYEELESRSLEINVLKGDPASKSFSFSQGGASDITAVSSDIHYIFEKPWRAGADGFIAAVSCAPLKAHLTPLALLLLSLFMARFNAHRLKDPLLFRFRKARSKAAADIKKAENAFQNGAPEKTVSIIYDSLTAYLSDKLGRPIGALTLKKTLELIRSLFPGIRGSSLDEIKELWERIELFHFSPSALNEESAKELISGYSALLDSLEKELKR